MLFRKPLIISKSNLLGQKDKRKLKHLIAERFEVKDADLILIPDSIDVTVLSFKGLKTLIYVSQGEPVLFDADGKGDIYPTISSLIKIPNLLRCFSIYHPVSEYIMNGADLMVPGIIVDNLVSNSHTETTRALGIDSAAPQAVDSEASVNGGASSGDSTTVNVKLFMKDRCMGIKVLGNPVPFAVGKCLINGAVQGKGKALEVMHIYGDQLWNMSTYRTKAPNEGFSLTRISPLIEGEQKIEIIDHKDKYVGKTSTGLFIENGEPTCDEEEKKSTVAAEPELILDKEAGLTSENKTTDLEIEREQQLQEQLQPTCNDSSSTAVTITDGDTIEPTNGVDATSELPLTAGLTLTTEVMDIALELALLETLHSDVNDSNIPMSISAVFSKMIENAPAVQFSGGFRERLLKLLSSDVEHQEVLVDQIFKGNLIVSLDVRKSSYKKLSKFFQHYAKEKLLQVKDLRGDLTLLSVNRKCTAYTKYIIISEKDKQNAKKKMSAASGNSTHGLSTGGGARDEAAAKKTASMAGKIEVLEFYHADSNAAVVFDTAGVKPSVEGRYYDAGQCREAIKIYLKKRDIKKGLKPSTIVLDEVLQNCILTKAERLIHKSDASPLEMEMANVIQTFISRLDSYHSVVKSSEEQHVKPAVRRGKLKPITIEIEKRAMNKAVTKIGNLNLFDIEEKSLAEMLQKSLAASSSTFEMPGAAKGKIKPLGVLVQGRFTSEVAQILNTQYGIPDRYITQI